MDEDDGTAIFTVTRSGATTETVSADWATADGSATSPGDYIGTSGAISIASGDTTDTIIISLTNDSIGEPVEAFDVNLTNPANATISQATGTATITDDEPTPTLTLANASRLEANANMTFTLTNPGPITQDDIEFSYSLAGGDATGGGVDYNSSGGTGAITGGTTSTTIDVPILEDTLYEGNETFEITVTVTTTNANSPVGPATGTITDDETKPTLTVSNESLLEQNGNMTFTVTNPGDVTQGNINFSYTLGWRHRYGWRHRLSSRLVVPAPNRWRHLLNNDRCPHRQRQPLRRQRNVRDHNHRVHQQRQRPGRTRYRHDHRRRDQADADNQRTSH